MLRWTVYQLQVPGARSSATLIDKAPSKSCQLDAVPTSIVVQSLDILLPVITKLLNFSFETGQFAGTWKGALVLPSLKKHNLDIAYKNFHAVSNLPYISKLSERASVHQFAEHLTVNPAPFPDAICAQVSTQHGNSFT